MAAYNGQQRFLLQAAERYHSLGYKVGFAKGKEFLGPYVPAPTVMTFWGPVKQGDAEVPEGFNAISLIPDGVVCVDFDEPDFGLVWEPLPPTWKERTPRGWHLFYYLDPEIKDKATPKIKWRPHVDLLVVAGKSTPPPKRRSAYGRGGADGPKPWGEHVLISRSDGYNLVWPDEVPPIHKLTPAPDWLVYQLTKP